MPDGSNPLKLRFYYPADDAVYAGAVQFIKEWLQEIGIATTATPKSEDELTPIENQGKFDLIVWSWTPYTDPTAMMSYLTCGQVPAKPDDGRYNDAFFCDPEYDRLFEAQATELDEPTRISLVKQAQQEFYTQAPYVVLYMQDTVEAYRNDRFTGFVRQPAETGPIIYTQSDPSYLLIKPVSGAPTSASTTGDGQQASSSDSGGGSSAAPIIIGVILAVGVIGGVGYGWSRRRKTADERE
jgi:peptide/nickel transport system substrate-binding protein